MIRLSGFLALALLLATPAAAEFEHGIIAVQQEKFEEARAEFTAAHEAGDERGTFMLGVMEEQGWGRPVDLAAATDWYRKAADSGLASAQFNLGVFYAEGRGVDQDFATALGFLTQAADQGHAGAMNNLGTMYENGYGAAADRAEAYKWYLLASEHIKGQSIMVVHNNVTRMQAELSAGEIDEANRRVAKWKKAHP